MINNKFYIYEDIISPIKYFIKSVKLIVHENNNNKDERRN